QAGKHADRRCFPGAVRTKERVQFAGHDPQLESVHRVHRTKGLVQPPRFTRHRLRRLNRKWWRKRAHGRRTEDGGRKTEDRGQKTEDWGRTEQSSFNTGDTEDTENSTPTSSDSVSSVASVFGRF